MNAILQDIRYRIRILLMGRGVTAAAVVTLALAIGVTTAMFSVVDAVVLRPLPYENPEGLVMVWETYAPSGFDEMFASAPDFLDWREQNQVFEHIAALQSGSVNLTGSGDPERVRAWSVSPSFFQILGVDASLGRHFLPEEENEGRHQVVVLSHGFWKRKLGADPSAVGRVVTLDGSPYTMVGVMPPGFEFPPGFPPTDLWRPKSFGPKDQENRRNHNLSVIARLKSGVSLARAQAEMSVLADNLETAFPSSNEEVGVRLHPLHEQIVEDVRPALLVLLAAVAFVLLIACANVANLMLARVFGRQQEYAMRSALGASRLHLIRLHLVESCLLALSGSALGLVIAMWGVDLLPLISPERIPRLETATFDGRMLGFTLAVTVATGILVGLAAAWHVANRNDSDSLKDSGRSTLTGSTRSGLRAFLVVSEIAIAGVLLIGALLLLQSFVLLHDVDPGFSQENVLTFRTSLPAGQSETSDQRFRFYEELSKRIASLPAVDSVGAISSLPLTRLRWDAFSTVEGRPVKGPNDIPVTVYAAATPEYFRAMNIPLLQGRTFSARDYTDSPEVVLISESMAERYWPGVDPIGKRIKRGRPEDDIPWLSVVGVVGDVLNSKLSSEVEPQVYIPYAFGDMSLVVRSRLEPASLSGAVRSEVRSFDAYLPLYDMQSIEDVLAASRAESRFSSFLLGLFASLALLLATVGIYGVMVHSANQRTHEIGLRSALGARASENMKLIVGQGFRQIAAGVVLGLLASMGLMRYLAGMLFGVTPTEPTVYALVAAILVAVALIACTIPARRASKVDPMVALRYE
jgi:putative ABC transport system permease protein